MRPYYSITTQPESEPLSYAQASDHLRVDSEDDIAYIEALCGVAREFVEGVTGRISTTQTILAQASSFDDFAPDGNGLLRVNRSPVQSVAFIKYYPADGGALTTIAAEDYRVLTAAEPIIIQHVDSVWPSTADRIDAVQISFVAGHNDNNPPPLGYMHAMKMLVAHLYEERKPIAFSTPQELPYSLQHLIEMHRVEGRVG
jgi:uncharacterized phiE125 gp8 family phage protein